MTPKLIRRVALMLGLLSPLALQAVWSQHLPGQVSRVVDGDTLMLNVRGSQQRVDLAGIDAPELNQPWGGTASARLHRRLTGSFIVVDVVERHAGKVYGRIVFKGRDLAIELLNDGLAWSIERPDDDNEGELAGRRSQNPYIAAEQRARSERKGLWSDEEPIAPWEWRSGRPLR